VYSTLGLLVDFTDEQFRALDPASLKAGTAASARSGVPDFEMQSPHLLDTLAPWPSDHGPRPWRSSRSVAQQPRHLTPPPSRNEEFCSPNLCGVHASTGGRLRWGLLACVQQRPPRQFWSPSRGRPIHPVNVRIGGFHRTPAPDELRPLAERLRQAQADALETVRWVAAFDFPDAVCDHDLLALRDPGRYAIDSGTPTVMDPVPREFPLPDFEEHVREEQVPQSTALTATLDGRRFLTGPLARYAINGR
jgi:hypothetical protein